MPRIDQILDLLDESAERCIGVESPEARLIDTYFELHGSLTGRVGTSSGFTGVSEYLFFRYLLKVIEHRIGESFIDEPLTSDVSAFRSPSWILAHDLDISMIARLPKMRPDIAVFSNRDGQEPRLVAVFEIKTYVVGRGTLKALFARFDKLAEVTDALFFPVFFCGQYKDLVGEFCERYLGRAFVISKEEYRNQIGLEEAVEVILGGHTWAE